MVILTAIRYHARMIVVTVLYPKNEQSRFDFDYYLEKHVPMVKARCEDFGLKEVRLMRGSAMVDGAPPQFELIGELVFPSLKNLQDALGRHGAEIMADIPNYSNVQPMIQISEAI